MGFKPLPTASAYYDDVVAVIGELTGHKAHVYVAQTDVRRVVLERHNLDPNNLPHNWPLDGRPSIHRKIDDAFRNQKHNDKWYRKAADALTEPGPKKGMWGLTDLGAEKARELNGVDDTDDSDAVPEEEEEASVETPEDDTPEDNSDDDSDDSDDDEDPEDPEDDPSGGDDDPDDSDDSETEAKAAKPVRPPLPTPRALFNAVIAVLGRMTRYRPNVTIVPKTAYDAILKWAGYDLSDLPAHFLPGQVTNKDSIYRKIQFAMRYQSATDRAKSRLPTLTRYDNGRQWGLTALGISLARELNGKSRHPNNETEAWFEDNWDNVYDALTNAVRRKLPASATMDLVEDHVHSYIEKSIRLNSLRKLLATGKSIPRSKVASYCVRSAFTEIRGWGVDAHCRAMRGALTERNRQDIAKAVAARNGGRVWWPRMSEGIGYETSGQGEDEQRGLVVVDQRDDHTVVEDTVDYERIMARVEAVLQEKRPESWKRYAEVVRLLADEQPTKLIAERLELTRYQASQVIGEVRKVLQAAYHQGALSGVLA